MTGSRATWAVVLAGGLGSRMAADRPKQLLVLGGRTILERSVEAFTDHPRVDRVVVVVPPGRRDEVAADLDASVLVVEGGRERSDSTRAAVQAVLAHGGTPDDRLLVHDAARPLVPARVVTDVVDTLDEVDVVATLVASVDTVVRLDPTSGQPGDPLPREELRRHQTPQGFRLGLLADAHAWAAATPSTVTTDDCTLVQHFDPARRVGIVAGDPRNLKITEPLDLVVAEAFLRQTKSR